MTFDSVLPELCRLCENHGLSVHVERFVAVRDVRGRVRLVVEPKQGQQVDSEELAALAAQLTDHLGGYFVAPILSTKDGKRDLQQLALSLVAMAAQSGAPWPRAWPTGFSDRLGVLQPLPNPGERWLGVDRTVGKDAWLGAETQPPWQLHGASNPPIVAFHSFKGGVGRTTLLLAHAVILASKGKRVALVDLDLEAPGLGTLVNAKSPRGVIDLLVDHLATGRTDLHDAIVPAGLPKPYDERISVVCAGTLRASYLEKLARLDFATERQGEASPVVRALESLLKVLRSHGKQGGARGYDAIIVDARAGLHDISGAAVHLLSDNYTSPSTTTRSPHPERRGSLA